MTLSVPVIMITEMGFKKSLGEKTFSDSRIASFSVFVLLLKRFEQ